MFCSALSVKKSCNLLGRYLKYKKNKVKFSTGRQFSPCPIPSPTQLKKKKNSDLNFYCVIICPEEIYEKTF